MNRRTLLKSIGIASSAMLLLPQKLFSYHAAVDSTGYLSQQKDSVRTFLETTQYTPEGWGRWKYNILMERKFGLESSAMGIQILDMLSALDAVPITEKKQALAFFQSTWHPEERYYIDPLVREEDRISDHHSWEHIWAHMSGASESAIKLLGGTPKSRGDKAPFVDLSQVDVQDWMLSLDWKNPWLYGERFSKVVRHYWNTLPKAEQSLEEPTIKKAFVTLEEYIIDPATGFPIKRGCESMEVGMAGLFKLISAYQTVGKDVLYPENALDSVLALQNPNGQFGNDNAPMTIHWDSLKVLKDLNQQMDYGYRFKEIKEAGNKSAEFLIKVHKKEDGGFSYFPQECTAVHNSVQLSKKGAVGDMEGTKFCLRCFSYADEWNASN